MEVFAHRGASGEYPENTITAFEQAIKQECDGIELDVQFHRSNALIICHDSHVLDHQQAPRLLHKIPLNELLTLPVGQGETIITLLQALASISGRCKVNIEVKTSYVEQTSLDLLVTILLHHINVATTKYGFSLNDFTISSFNHLLLVKIHRLCESIRLAALIACSPLQLDSFVKDLPITQLNVALESANLALIEQARQQKLKLGIYTVNHLEDIKQSILWQADIIFSDFPKQTKYHIKNIQLD